MPDPVNGIIRVKDDGGRYVQIYPETTTAQIIHSDGNDTENLRNIIDRIIETVLEPNIKTVAIPTYSGGPTSLIGFSIFTYNTRIANLSITYTSISNPPAGSNPRELSWFEEVSGEKTETSDTTVTSGKTYYYISQATVVSR